MIAGKRALWLCWLVGVPLMFFAVDLYAQTERARAPSQPQNQPSTRQSGEVPPRGDAHSSGDVRVSEDVRAAQALFDEAVQLMERGEFARACPKLQESQRLDPAGGTLLNLGYCLEKLGRLASAHQAYGDALRRALEDERPERASLARNKLEAIEPRLSHLTLVVSDALQASPNVVVSLNGEQVAPRRFSSKLPLDPGSYVITAARDGEVFVTRNLRVLHAGEVHEVVISEAPNGSAAVSLEPGTAAGTTGPDVLAPEPAPEPSRTGAWIAGASSLALLSVGTVGAILAAQKHNESNELCDNSSECRTEAGVDAEDAANRYAWVANVGIGAGILAGGLATYLWISATPSPDNSTYIVGSRGHF